MRCRSTLALVGILVVACGCASAPTIQPVADPMTPIRAAGFSVLPPSGGHWVQSATPSLDRIVFAKVDPAHAQKGGSVMVIAVRMKARSSDIRSVEELRSEIDESIRSSSARFTMISSKTEAYVDQALGADCVRVETVSEERNNPNRAGTILLMTIFGKACRHTSSSAHYVQVTCSERRPAGSTPLLDETLRKECARVIESLSFQPLP
jgi:hypothetical protein